jgi:hypothetical protein
MDKPRFLIDPPRSSSPIRFFPRLHPALLGYSLKRALDAIFVCRPLLHPGGHDTGTLSTVKIDQY